MVIGAALWLWVGVHQRGGQAWYRMQQGVFGVDRNLVRGDCAGTWVNDDFAFGAEMVADPPQPDLADA
jgi:hypothetical protein